MEKIEIVRRAKVRQAKPYYLRELRGKAARLKELKALKAYDQSEKGQDPWQKSQGRKSCR